VLLVFFGALLPFSVHHVREGHIGVYWKGGALQKSISDPGFHLKIPFYTRFEDIQITMQTDSVEDIPCGTSGGVMIYFQKVEVVNKLKKEKVYTTLSNYGINYDKMWIFDKIHHEINQFCSRHSLQEVYTEKFDTLDEFLIKAIQNDCEKFDTGIEIIAVRVTKPTIPESIRQNFERVESEKTRLLIAIQSQKVIEKEADTERKRETIEALKRSEVSLIHMEKEIQNKLSNQKIRSIEDQMATDTIKIQTDSLFYKKSKEAESDLKRLSPEFLQYTLLKKLSKVPKVYYGEKIQEMGFKETDFERSIKDK